MSHVVPGLEIGCLVTQVFLPSPRLGLLMFSVGITTTISDFKECLKRPGAVATWSWIVLGAETQGYPSGSSRALALD